ncbi:MAG: cation transporter [Halobacteriovoraceae bacterium]|nr:cation transporter [Halobacteriovoraceae bacterium]MCB9095281.1 cation transporter [Halobacteriovoraceae bacterium]
MGHAHDHHHHHHHAGAGKNILIAFFLNISFAVIEVIGGYFTNSVAIYSDALHDFGDSMALLFSYFAEKLSHKKADSTFTFGYRRFSVLSAFINGIILLLGSFYVIYEAISRILNPEPVVPEGMFGLAILGIVVNSIAAYRLSKTDGLNPRMVMFHLIEDILGWIAVLIVSITLFFKPWYLLDSILSILISLIILRGVYKNLLRVAAIFLQKFPSDLELGDLKKKIESLSIVKDVHAFKGWSIDDESYYLRFHVKVPSATMMSEVDKIKSSIKDIITQYNIKYSTIEFESEDTEDCKL